jgi:hypothetical protein
MTAFTDMSVQHQKQMSELSSARRPLKKGKLVFLETSADLAEKCTSRSEKAVASRPLCGGINPPYLLLCFRWCEVHTSLLKVAGDDGLFSRLTLCVSAVNHKCINLLFSCRAVRSS